MEKEGRERWERRKTEEYRRGKREYLLVRKEKQSSKGEIMKGLKRKRTVKEKSS